ncbi:MPN396 family protein [Mycoplasmoides alvi]|uniref:MPN396 family protein n=1 Tax=Mycoplasmoides alvi TaxID=78580 RepID=UPI00051BF187|nr:hypothetical protein [Mycoplasmoides alvi]
MSKKRLSFDLILKSTIIFVLMILSIIGIVFGSLRIADKVNRGPSYEGTISTTVYFSPYESTNTSSQSTLDFTKPRVSADTQLIQDIPNMLQGISDVYANRLYAQGFSQVVISSNVADTNAKNIDSSLMNPSWLVNNSLPSITVTVNKLNPEKREELNYTQQVIRETTFDIARSFKLSFETTDGISVFDSALTGQSESTVNQAAKFIQGSATATRPSVSSTDSSLTLELNIPGSNLNVTDDGALTYINKFLNDNGHGSSDYFVGNGQASVEGTATGLFNPGANGTTVEGNRNLILWSDKDAALAYVRHIFNVTESSLEFISFSTPELNLWKFLHRRDPYDGSTDTTKNTSLKRSFSSANEITLDNLYYIYAAPSAFKSAAADDSSSTSEISTPLETRTGRGSPNDYSSLFSPYILYEARTTNAKDSTQNSTLSSLFPKNQTFSHGGNTKFVLTQTLNDTGSYANLDFATASRFANLINSGNFNNNVQIISANSSDNLPILQSTFVEIDAFAASIIALGVFVLLIGIIISVLYRIPGLFSFLPILLGAVLSLLLYNEFGGIIDLFTFIGLIGLISIGIGCLLLIFETFRRNVRNSTSIIEASRLAYKNTFMKIVDVHLVLLILGLFLMYVGKYQESAFGVLLVVGTFISFFVVYGSSTIYIKLFMSMNNWSNPNLFVFKKDAKWLNQITGQLNLTEIRNKEILTSSLMNVDDELQNLFKQSFKNVFFNNRTLWCLLIWASVVVLGVITLILFGLGIVLPLDASVQRSGLLMFISILGAMGITALYLIVRYRWIVVLPYLVTSIVIFFILISTLLIFNSVIALNVQFESIFVLLIAWVFSQVGIIFSISWNYNYWYSYVIYKKESLIKLTNNNIFTSKEMFTCYMALPLIGMLILSLFNLGGDGMLTSDSLNGFMFVLLAILAISIFFSTIAVQILFSQLLGLMMLARQSLMNKTKKKLEVRYERTDYDRFDEQIIPGINDNRIGRQY